MLIRIIGPVTVQVIVEKHKFRQFLKQLIDIVVGGIPAMIGGRGRRKEENSRCERPKPIMVGIF